MTVKLFGRIVLPDQIIESGTLVIQDGCISKIVETKLDGAIGHKDDWILPGFIDIHLHGLGNGEPASREGLIAMAAFAPSTGVTCLCPTLGTVEFPVLIEYLKNIKTLINNPPSGAVIAGAHLEGPYINHKCVGGMAGQLLRVPDVNELAQILEASEGVLKIMTLSPELDGALPVIRRLKEAGCVVAAGHTACNPEDLSYHIENGISHICHLFDTFAGRNVDDGVSQPCLADMVLIEDRVTCEIIMDGIHVPEPLVKLAVRSAGEDRIIAITDAMQGAGLPDGEYLMSDGRSYILTNGGVCRTKETGDIVGSCLTMNQAFMNMTQKFGFNACFAVKTLSTNPARLLGLDNKTGRIETGLDADITVLSASGKVKKCFVKGNIACGN